MSTDHADRDQRLGAALVECLEQIDRGGEADREDLLARYPEFADELAKFLDGERILERRGAPLRDVVRRPAEGGLLGGGAGGHLGDFRILREVGRGGMGVVYEAEQISLGRRVALKVLPFAATMDPRQLQRFHNEARAAASLHHEHVVPVYAVGCERGVHYFAMQFIEGRTLAQVIAAQIRDGHSDEPTGPYLAADDATANRAKDRTAKAPRDAAYSRRVAEWGIQAAEALEHAHALGIVHRDVKPGNLMIDERGKLWVTDFGLARTAAESNLTMTGDVLGTLRYASAEQALARHGLLDHRTDVYALGATLYELLCGRPAVEGANRVDVLRQVTTGEPPPLRRVSRTVPRDLETVVMKCLAKEPVERYATAQDLADDLRRWLENRPVSARQPTLAKRGAKWVRRHRAACSGPTRSASSSPAATASRSPRPTTARTRSR
jgi:serine/threonine protein kinase